MISINYRSEGPGKTTGQNPQNLQLGLCMTIDLAQDPSNYPLFASDKISHTHNTKRLRARWRLSFCPRHVVQFPHLAINLRQIIEAPGSSAWIAYLLHFKYYKISSRSCSNNHCCLCLAWNSDASRRGDVEKLLSLVRLHQMRIVIEIEQS